MELKGFNGLRNTVDPERLAAEDLAEAINIDLDDSGKPSLRAGRTRVLAITGAHSLFSPLNQAFCLFVQASELRLLNADYTQTAIRVLSTNARMAYVEHAGKVYYSNGIDTGVYTADDHHSWGMARPALPRAYGITGGMLPPGRYQYSLTYVADDGQESGAIMAAQVPVPEAGGIEFTDLPVPSGTRIVAKRLYLTPANGDVLYYAMDIPAADTTAYYFGSGIELTTPLSTQFMTKPIPGTVLASYNGSILIGAGEYIYHTEALGPELMRPGAYYKMASEVRVIAPTTGGVYVGTADRHVFLQGDDPANLGYKELQQYGAVKGTLAEIPSHLLGLQDQATERVPMWTTKAGIVVGPPGGQLLNITESRYQFGAMADVGTAILRRDDGINQYLSIIE